MTIHGPKYVKAANMWIVTVVDKNRETPNWFGTNGEAEEFIRKNWEEYKIKMEV